ncbi:conserved hypothetical protein [Candidatus Magnetomoraceae bacterium gMMP-15]
MNQVIIDKFIKIKHDIIEEKGDFTLFALFLRDNSPNKWDVVVAGPWLDSDKNEAYNYLSKQITLRLEPKEMTSLARIALIDETNPGLSEVLRASKDSSSSIIEIMDSVFFEQDIRHAYIFSSN